jgi:hypothetical protein
VWRIPGETHGTCAPPAWSLTSRDVWTPIGPARTLTVDLTGAPTGAASPWDHSSRSSGPAPGLNLRHEFEEPTNPRAMYSHLFCGGLTPLSGKLLLAPVGYRRRGKVGPGEQRAHREAGAQGARAKDQGETLTATSQRFPRAGAAQAWTSGDRSRIPGHEVKRTTPRSSPARGTRVTRLGRVTRSGCASGLDKSREHPTLVYEAARVHSLPALGTSDIPSTSSAGSSRRGSAGVHLSLRPSSSGGAPNAPGRVAHSSAEIVGDQAGFTPTSTQVTTAGNAMPDQTRKASE